MIAQGFEIVFIAVFFCFLGLGAMRWFMLRSERALYVQEVKRLAEIDPDKEFNFFPGIVYDRICRGISERHPRLQGIDRIFVAKVDGTLQLFGAWTRSGKIELDPHPFYLPLTDIDSKELKALGEYLVEVAGDIERMEES